MKVYHQMDTQKTFSTKYIFLSSEVGHQLTPSICSCSAALSQIEEPIVAQQSESLLTPGN